MDSKVPLRFFLPAYTVLARAETRSAVGWRQFYGALPPGEYRIIRTFFDEISLRNNKESARLAEEAGEVLLREQSAQGEARREYRRRRQENEAAHIALIEAHTHTRYTKFIIK